MAIETICRGCARKLRVGDEFAGRKARCPHCKTIYTVPAGGAGLDASSEDTSDNWLLRTKDGAVYGPVSKSELDGWRRDGRLDATSQVRIESEGTWRQATELYPALMPMAAAKASPFSSRPASPVQASNPYSPPGTGGPAGRVFRAHRGGMILAFGLIGFVCCQVFSIVAWVMGHADMKEIDAGRMDPEGRGLTQAGMIIGIIGTVLFILVLGFQAVMVLFMVVSEM